ncbi:MAG: hypothetical protein JHC93_06540 [Parachlamydiales bacterium]|nr:hypothetical protein [Parachlamydiales bacterium]
MKIKKIATNSLVGLLAVLTTGCASYKASNLNALDTEVNAVTQKKDGITVQAKTFDKYDCKRYLDRNVIKEGFQPIQLTIKNDSSRRLILSSSNISLPSAAPNFVAQSVHTSTAGRAIGYGVGAYFTFGVLAIPAVVDGIKSSQANKALDIDFANKALEEKVLLPHSLNNGLIFVPVDQLQHDFKITFVDADTNETIEMEVTC